MEERLALIASPFIQAMRTSGILEAGQHGCLSLQITIMKNINLHLLPSVINLIFKKKWTLEPCDKSHHSVKHHGVARGLAWD